MKVGAKIVQRITGNTASDVAHSSGLAGMQQNNLQRRGGMTFAERQNIAQNRSLVQGYGNSKIARDFAPGARTNSYGRSETVQRSGYGRTEGAPDMRCRYGRTETADRDSYGRKSAEDVKNERMAQHSDEKRPRTATPGSGNVATSNTAAQPSQQRKYYDFRPDFGAKMD